MIFNEEKPKINDLCTPYYLNAKKTIVMLNVYFQNLIVENNHIHSYIEQNQIKQNPKTKTMTKNCA